MDRLLFSKLINDRSEAGLFIDNDGLRDMLTQLQIQTPQHLQRRSQKAASTVSEASRHDYVRAIFKLCELELLKWTMHTGRTSSSCCAWTTVLIHPKGSR